MSRLEVPPPPHGPVFWLALGFLCLVMSMLFMAGWMVMMSRDMLRLESRQRSVEHEVRTHHTAMFLEVQR